MLRFVRNCLYPKSERQSGTLYKNELKQARTLYIRVSHPESHSQDVITLKTSGIVSSKSELLCLSPFLDEDEITRAGGRIESEDSLFCSCHRLVLPPDHELTRLIVMNCYQQLRQEGLEHVRNPLRRRYWILRCRAKDYPSVFILQEEESKTTSYTNGKSTLRSFINSIFILQSRGGYLWENKRGRRYGCLFTCLAT